MDKPSASSSLPGSLRMLMDRQRLFLSEGLGELFGGVSEVFFEAAEMITDSAVQRPYFEAIKTLRAQRKSIQKAILGCAARELEASFEVDHKQMESQFLRSSDDLNQNLWHSQDVGAASAGPQPEVLEQGADPFGSSGNDELEMIVRMDTMVSSARAQSRHILSQLAGRVATVLDRFADIEHSPLLFNLHPRVINPPVEHYNL